MRNLTIVRAKSFAGCAASMKVYIEDPMCDDLTINGLPCRFLGKLKNGEVKTFQIDEGAAKVFVIADKLSKGFCNEYCPLEAGTEDITLVGKNHYNPFAGNPFRFEGVTDPDVLKNRKKGAKVGTIVLIASVLVGFAVGWFATSGILNGPAEAKEFTVKGMHITLDENFKESIVQGYDAGYESKKVALLILKENFSLMAGFGDKTLDEYGQLVLQSNQQTATLQKKGNYLYYEYTSSAPNGNTYHYFVTLHKGTDAFWVVQFFTLEKDADNYRDEILDWAATVRFD